MKLIQYRVLRDHDFYWILMFSCSVCGCSLVSCEYCRPVAPSVFWRCAKNSRGLSRSGRRGRRFDIGVFFTVGVSDGKKSLLAGAGVFWWDQSNSGIFFYRRAVRREKVFTGGLWWHVLGVGDTEVPFFLRAIGGCERPEVPGDPCGTRGHSESPWLLFK